MPDAASPHFGQVGLSLSLYTSPMIATSTRLTSTHYFRQRQVVFIVKLGILIQAKVCQAFAFLVAPSA